MNARLTPSRYEAYLQIYKSPRKAIDSASRFQLLRNKDNRNEAEEKEFQKLKRIDDLAWDYDAAHKYMVEKSSYNQQDVDYAFSLAKLEQQDGVTGPMTNAPASSVYKSLILEKIFGGARERLENDFTLDDVQDKDKLKTWLDNDMCECIRRRPNEMKSVISGLKKTMPPESSQEEVLAQLMAVIKDEWIKKVFNVRVQAKVKDKESPMKKAGDAVPPAFAKLMKDSELKKKLEEAIIQVFRTDLNLNPIIELD